MSGFKVGDRVQYNRHDGVVLVGKVTGVPQPGSRASVALVVTHAQGSTSLLGREIATSSDNLAHID